LGTVRAGQKQREVTGALITIGDEILLGEISNENATYIASNLRNKGFRLHSIITIGDQEGEIIDVLCRYTSRSDFLLVTGGLGSTEDDRTIASVSRAFGVSLTSNNDYRKRLQEEVAQRGLSWSAELDKLTMMPETSIKIGRGMAGFMLEHKNIPCYFLPGVPWEMQQLLDEQVVPDLERRFPIRPVYVKQIIRIQGLPESSIANRLQQMDLPDDRIDVSYLPQGNENWVTVLVTAATKGEAAALLADTRARIMSRIGPEHISGQDDDTLEKVIGRQLREKNWKMAAAESCTGGRLSMKITAVPGASDYFERAFITYSNGAKVEMLEVPEMKLQEFGAVSAPVAQAMAEGARKQAKVQVALAITGVAGPSGGTLDKPIGTVFLACATGSSTRVEKHLFHGTRDLIQEQSAQAALVLLWRTLSR
jgi:nicotinamide-nucleotide amidase